LEAGGDAQLSIRLSVVIPAYNRAALIGETLRSLLAQTVAADEIIVVDDGSTDDTAAAAAAFGPPVRVVRQTNRGPAAARNRGFSESRGQFIHFFDSDDLAASNKPEVQVGALEASGADIAYGPWVKGHFEGDRFLADNHVFQQGGLPPPERMVETLLTYWSIVPHAALFRRSIVEKARGFPEELVIAEDQAMFLNCLLAGARVVHTRGTIEFYRLGEGSKMTESPAWARHRIESWARFLLSARISCLAHGVEPLRWFGYRRRLWEAAEDLKPLPGGDPEIARQLQAVVSEQPSLTAYHWHRQLERWRGGLQSRLTGGRAHSSFQAGPMQPGQVALLGQLGYRPAGRRKRWQP
jgi:glycosyltransferase involved in cell wall biosynthesis